MITVQQAEAIIHRHLFTPQIETVALTEAIDKVLGEPISADRDFPPFNRVAMDGIAVTFAELQNGRKEFRVERIQAAGEPVKSLGDKTACVEVMTGAMLPVGTDTVIRYEDIKIEHGVARLQVENLTEGSHIHRQGQDAKAGGLLIEAGTIISPAEVALLATVGYANVKVLRYPRTAIVASGDELIPVTGTPLPHQIRRSNTYAIEASMKKLGWKGEQFHFPDDKAILSREFRTILEKFDVVILSGGVSKGQFDFIPEVLQECGIENHFHQVSQRPGKPFWFGSSTSGKIVFALPGNPVSTFMCFYRFIRPWFLTSLGQKQQQLKALLAEDFKFDPKLTYFLQVKVKNEAGRLLAYPRAGGGSGDFANLKDVDGFLELPLEKSVFKAGEVYDFIAFR